MAILSVNQLVTELSKLNTPMYVMFVGLVGSGKSTIIKHIKDFAQFVVVSTDDIIQEQADQMGITYSQAFKKVSQSKVRREYNERLQDALYLQRNILVDQTNLMKSARQKKLRQIPDEYTKVCVIVSVSESEREKRLRDRAITTGKEIPQHVQEAMLKSYMTPSKDEGFDKILQVSGVLS